MKKHSKPKARRQKSANAVQSETLTPQVEEALRAGEERLRALTDNLPGVVVYQIDSGEDGKLRRFTYISEGVQRLHGITVAEALNDAMTIYGQVFEEDRLLVAEREASALASMMPFSAEVRLRLPSGEVRSREFLSAPRRLHDQRLVWDGIEIDITERKLAEKKIKQNLKGKETLLKEIHHRVKNNMSVISGLLHLMSDRIEDKTMKGLFEESRQWIKSMALVHEKLYRTADLAHIDFSDYITSIVTDLLTSYHAKGREISTIINVRDIMLDIDTAIPCGQIINELITNALKYAFPERTHGEISVSFTKSANIYTLIIKDNGIGLPEGFDHTKTNTLGLQLVEALTRQLRGTLQFQSDVATRQGTEVIITFKGKDGEAER